MRNIINVGRQFGSGGKLIALELGEKLSIKVYDNELISKAAEESGFNKELFIKRDENRSLFSGSIFFDSGRYNIANNYLNDHELFIIQSNIIKSIADKENAIFLGRCSNYILRDRPCLNIFIKSPLEVRKARVASRSNISLEEAESLILKQDRTREAYYNYFSFGNWGSASNYDLCIDSSKLDIKSAADFIIDFGKKSGLLK